MLHSKELQAIATDTQSSLYEQDFLQWLDKTADLLRRRKFSELELELLIEEIEDMGRSNKSAMRSNLMIVMLHLLKWQYQPEKRTNSWKSSIREHRIRLEEDFEDSPSLKDYVREILTKTYQNARKLAADQTGLELATFPQESPFTLAQILDSEFLP